MEEVMRTDPDLSRTLDSLKDIQMLVGVASPRTLPCPTWLILIARLMHARMQEETTERRSQGHSRLRMMVLHPQVIECTQRPPLLQCVMAACRTHQGMRW